MLKAAEYASAAASTNLMACSLTPLLSELTARLHTSANNALEADHAAATSGCGTPPPCGVLRKLLCPPPFASKARTCLQASTTVSRRTPVPDSNAAFTTAACESCTRARHACEYGHEQRAKLCARLRTLMRHIAALAHGATRCTLLPASASSTEARNFRTAPAGSACPRVRNPRCVAPQRAARRCEPVIRAAPR